MNFYRFTFFLLLPLHFITAADLVKIDNLSLVKHAYNDGDSFHASNGNDHYFLRLYLIDTPESTADNPTMAKRVREQTRYFGFEDYAVTVTVGKDAAAFTEMILSKPFTAYTSFSDARGSSAEKRVYAFIETADGQDLGQLLVQHGLARSYGVGRVNHLGLPQDEQKARLDDLECAAMLGRKGIWQFSNPDKIAELRALERKEDLELKHISNVTRTRPAGSKININSASAGELEILPGIGKVYAERIIQNRPYTSVEGLAIVKGLSTKTIDRLKPLIEL